MKRLPILATGLILSASILPMTSLAQTYYDEYGEERPAGYVPSWRSETTTTSQTDQYLQKTNTVVTHAVATSSPVYTAVPSPTNPDICRTDSSLSGYARQRVSNAANQLNDQMRSYTLDSVAEEVKEEIEDTSQKTGGKLRDIYIGGASIDDKQGMVEEYLLGRLNGLSEFLENQAEQQADSLINTIAQNVSQPAPMLADHRGTGTATRSISSRTPTGSRRTRSGSFKLKARDFIGIHQDVGRFNFTITSRNQIVIRRLRFKQQYDACADPRRTSFLEYGAEVTVRPVIEVRYRFSKLGSRHMNSHYRTFSGRFFIINNDREVVRTLDVHRPL